MKRLLLAIGVLIISVGASASDGLTAKEIKWLKSNPEVSKLNCDEFEKLNVEINSKPIAAEPTIFKNGKLDSNGRSVCFIATSTQNDSHRLAKTEKFVINGTNVSIYHGDGSGVIGDKYSDDKSWLTSCYTDPMTDEYSCSIKNKKMRIIRDDQGYTVVIGVEHFPNTNAFIRLDKGKPIESSKDGIYSHQQSKQIIDDMANAQAVTTRFTQWPYERFVDDNINISNYPTAKVVLDLIYDNHK